MPLINHCNGGGGTPQLCGQVENFKVMPGTTALTAALTWAAPDPDEDNSFVGVRIVRKVDSTPTGINDGTVVYEGTALSYTDTGLTAGTTYYYRAFAYNAKKKYQTAKRTVSIVGTNLTIGATLNDTTWAQISAVSQAGYAALYWAVGDTKSIIIDGDVASFNSGTYYATFSQVAVDAFILGFDHNAGIEGTKRIHFHIGKQDGKQTTLSTYSGKVSSGQGEFVMGSNSTWSECIMRTDTLGSNKANASSPGAHNLLAALPSDLRAVMKTCVKYSVLGDTVEKTTEILPLLSLVECFGNGASTIDVAGNHQKQYDYYRAGNETLHYIIDGGSINWSTGRKYTQRVWLRDRSYYSNPGYYWFQVGDDGSQEKYNYSNNSGVAPIFFV